jgi:hypothetical protein
MALDRRKPKEEQKITRKKDQVEREDTCGIHVPVWEHLLQPQFTSKCKKVAVQQHKIQGYYWQGRSQAVDPGSFRRCTRTRSCYCSCIVVVSSK